jgi:hypothetical protein
VRRANSSAVHAISYGLKAQDEQGLSMNQQVGLKAML